MPEKGYRTLLFEGGKVAKWEAILSKILPILNRNKFAL